jgi:uncharacterized C2H2 Zn-finger protein
MSNKRDRKTSEIRVVVTKEEIEVAFRAMVLKIKCPHCGEVFTDGAVDWGDAWREGRIDTLREFDTQERDGPYKVKCEWCDGRSFINYFARTASKTE